MIHPSTLVETTEGLLPISEIADSGTIATPSGPAPYKDKTSHEDRDCICLTTAEGYEAIVTVDHRIEEVMDGGNTSFIRPAASAFVGMQVRVRMGATVEPLDECGAVQPFPESHKTGSSFYDAGSLAEFLGILFTHGGVFLGERTSFGVASLYHEIAAKFEHLCMEQFGLGTEKTPAVESGLLTCSSGDEQVSKWLWDVSPGKAVPRCILQSPSTLQRAFLSAAFYEARLNVIRLKSSSATVRNLPVSALRVLQTMLLRIGVPSLLRTEENPSLSVDKKYVQPETGELWPDVRPWLLTRVSRVERLRGPVVGVEAPTTGLLIANGFPWGDK